MFEHYKIENFKGLPLVWDNTDTKSPIAIQFANSKNEFIELLNEAIFICDDLRKTGKLFSNPDEVPKEFYDFGTWIALVSVWVYYLEEQGYVNLAPYEKSFYEFMEKRLSNIYNPNLTYSVMLCIIKKLLTLEEYPNHITVTIPDYWLICTKLSKRELLEQLIEDLEFMFMNNEKTDASISVNTRSNTIMVEPNSSNLDYTKCGFFRNFQDKKNGN